MALDLYYFLSSLPLLKFTEPPLMSYERFLQYCRECLTPADATAVAAITLDPAADNAATGADAFRTVRQWHDFDTLLRNAAARLRAARLSRPAPAPRPTDSFSMDAEKRVTDAFAVSSPAERAALVDRLRWDYLESLTPEHTFDRDAIALYALKLLLLERIASRNLEQGLASYNTLVDHGVNQAAEHRVQL